MQANKIPDVAQTGFQASEAYDNHRPSYPPEAIDRLLKRLGIKGRDGARVLDLGAGTGKFTALLAERPEAYAIIAVEPHDDMRQQLERKQLPRVSIQNETAERMEAIADGSLDAVIASQSFHWYANVNALKEIYRVLKPAGVLGMIWNIEDYNSPRSWQIHEGWETNMRDVMWDLDDGHPRFRDMKWKDVFDKQVCWDPISLLTSTPMFGLPIGEETFDFVRWLLADDIWNTWQTYSQVANLSDEGLAETRKIFLESITSPGTEQDSEGRVAVHGRTYLAWTNRIPDEPVKSGG